MKKITTLVLVGIAVAAMAINTSISWEATSIYLGEVKSGESVDLSFNFTNTSDAAIQITNAKGSCGCTNVQYPQTSIGPGEQAAITATFNSSKAGVFKKNIRITTSISEEPTYLYFSGEVVN